MWNTQPLTGQSDFTQSQHHNQTTTAPQCSDYIQFINQYTQQINEWSVNHQNKCNQYEQEIVAYKQEINHWKSQYNDLQNTYHSIIENLKQNLKQNQKHIRDIEQRLDQITKKYNDIIPEILHNETNTVSPTKHYKQKSLDIFKLFYLNTVNNAIIMMIYWVYLMIY